MSIPSPPHIMEFRVARAVMLEGNLGPARLIDMLEKKEVFFCKAELREFKACPHCKAIADDFPDAFRDCTVADMGLRAAIMDKLHSAGKIATARLSAADTTVRMVAIAAREGMNCVLQPNTVFWDNMAACAAGQVTPITAQDFIAAL